MCSGRVCCAWIKICMRIVVSARFLLLRHWFFLWRISYRKRNHGNDCISVLQRCLPRFALLVVISYNINSGLKMKIRGKKNTSKRKSCKLKHKIAMKSVEKKRKLRRDARKATKAGVVVPGSFFVCTVKHDSFSRHGFSVGGTKQSKIR